MPKKQRDGRGRFLPGNDGGPGNPHARQVAAYRSALHAAVSVEDLAAVARRLITDAKSGSTAAARLILAYLIGNPSPLEEPVTDLMVLRVEYGEDVLKPSDSPVS